MSMDRYRTLGRSGLVISPLALGTMTFGEPGWGVDAATAAAILDAYIEVGGNFIDTADVYAGGRGEEMLGQHMASRGVRERLVVATKASFHSGQRGDVNGAGNGSKNIHRALEGSLRRLRTDYIDMYWLHAWDLVTPIEEVLQTLGDLQRAGKIRYFGFSDVPAWYATRAATLAAAHAIPGPIALQLEYSLIERSIEREHIHAARACGLGVVPWGPLAAGFLTGKYERADDQPRGAGRFDAQRPWRAFTPRHWQIMDALRAVSAEQERTPAEVALAWAAAQAGISALLLGATSAAQLRANLTSAQLKLTAAQLDALDAASALEPAHPYMIMTPQVNRMLFGGAAVQGWR